MDLGGQFADFSFSNKSMRSEMETKSGGFLEKDELN